MITYAPFVSAGLLSDIESDIRVNDTYLTVYEKRNMKPAIDDVICQHLDGSTLKNALNFIDYVRASKMKIKWSATNVWSVRYKNKHVLDIILRGDSWRVRLVYNHMGSNQMFTELEKAQIQNLIGTLRNSIPENLEPIPALS